MDGDHLSWALRAWERHLPRIPVTRRARKLLKDADAVSDLRLKVECNIRLLCSDFIGTITEVLDLTVVNRAITLIEAEQTPQDPFPANECNGDVTTVTHSLSRHEAERWEGF